MYHQKMQIGGLQGTLACKILQIKNKVVEELVGLLTVAQPLLIRLTLRLLYNLSFNQDLRASMVIQGLPETLVPLLGERACSWLIVYVY